jgi:type IV pilus assembly protein PilB
MVVVMDDGAQRVTTPPAAGPARLRDVLRHHGVTDARVVSALERVPRSAFLPPELALHAGDDRSFLLAPGQEFTAPGVLGRLLQALDVREGMRVLEVGSGLGYGAALLAVLGADVTALTPDAESARELQRRLGRLGVHVRSVVGAEDAFDPGEAFDRVLVGSPVAALPPGLQARLAHQGVLTALVRGHGATATLVRVVRHADHALEPIVLGSLPLAYRIGDLLVATGTVQRDAVERVAREAHGRLGQALLEQGLIHENDLYRALASQTDLVFASAEQILGRMDRDLAEALPKTFVETHRMLPFQREGDTVSIVTSVPDANPADVLKAVGASKAHVFLVTPTDFRRLRTATQLGLHAPAASAPTSTADDLLERHPLDDVHLVALFEAILLEAIGERASDIHLERYGGRVRVRLRVDGDLREVPHITMTAHELAGVVNVLKVASNLDISERRLPQGGRFRRRAGEHVFDLRVQTQPTLHGEHAVIRLLPQTVQPLTIEDLGFEPSVAQTYRRLLDSPAGLVLVVGPTGSGKSTTLYAALQVLARDETRKVITVEDPIEYSMENVQQTQVHPDIGFAFANAMRSFVRQDPDVILVGEIRDGETALEAIRASQTGHVVLSTLHCNDSVDAVQRLLDLGMHPNSIASELLAVVAQRLAKRICTHCREETTPEPKILAELFPAGAPSGFRAWKGRGCDRCRGHGTHGRIAAVELLRATPNVRRAIARGLAVDDLRDIAVAEGLRSTRQSALWLVSQGVIPLSELPAILPLERMAGE